MLRMACLCALVMVGHTGIRAQQPEVYSLKKCLDVALENNLSLQNQRQDIDKKRVEIQENRTKLLPQIQAFGNFTNFIDKPASVSLSSAIGSSPAEGQPYMQSQGMRYNTTAGLQMALPLYNQQAYTGISIAKRMEEISKLNYEMACENLIVEVAKAYYQAQTIQQQMALVHENISRLTELRDITRAFYDNGMSMEVDLQRVELNLDNVQVQYDNVASTYQQQLRVLKYIMGIAPDLAFEPQAFSEDVGDKQAVMTGMSEGLYEIRLLEAKQDVLETERKLIKQGYLPTLSFVGQLGYTKYANHFGNIFNSDDTRKWYNSFYWGLSLSIPVFDGFNKQAKLRKNKIDLGQNRLALEDLKQHLHTDYDNACNSYLNNGRNFSKQKKNWKLAESVYGVTLDKYREGVASMTELLQDEIGMSNAQNNYLNALYSYKLSELNLLKLGQRLDVLTK